MAAPTPDDGSWHQPDRGRASRQLLALRLGVLLAVLAAVVALTVTGVDVATATGVVLTAGVGAVELANRLAGPPDSPRRRSTGSVPPLDS